MRKKRTKKAKKRFQYLNPRAVGAEVRRYGYRFSYKRYITYFIGLFGCVAGLSYLYRLKLPFIAVICIAAVGFVPGIFMTVYRTMYEEKRFLDITAYMEQLLYSFKRRAKILDSLEDTLALFQEGESRLYDAILQAIYYIQIAQAKENLYREAFAFIEKEYGCSRLYKIHDFLIEAEEVGGDFAESADILLKDRKLWIDRVYELQREKKNVKIKITIGIGLSFLICGMTVLMLPKEFEVTDNMVSQTVTTLTVLANLSIWYFAQMKLSKGLIQSEDGLEFEEVKRQYDFVMHGDMRRERKRGYFTAMLLLPAVIFFGLKGSMLAAGLLSVLAALLATHPERRYKVSLKHLTRAVEKAFPEWLMSMSLQLQTDNVHVSLEKSIPNAPKILQEELTGLLGEIETAPDSVHPYLRFMEKVPLPDITSAMKVLYSMAEFGAADIGAQIAPLVERNAAMTDKAERMRAEDEIAGIGFLVLLPMITGVVKMLADLALVMVYILSTVKNIS